MNHSFITEPKRHMLNTPFGNISIFINKKETPYDYLKLENKVIGQLDIPIFDVDGRYKITIDINDFTMPISIKCMLPENVLYDKTCVETGERLALKSWYLENLKISIGTEDEVDGIEITYLDQGLEIGVTKHSTKQKIIIGVAWKLMTNPEKEDVYTWFAAEPPLHNIKTTDKA